MRFLLLLLLFSTSAFAGPYAIEFRDLAAPHLSAAALDDAQFLLAHALWDDDQRSHYDSEALPRPQRGSRRRRFAGE